jgi:hypothetical protein
VAEPHDTSHEVEAVGAGLKLLTGAGPATVTLIAEPGTVILAVSGPGGANDLRLPLWALEHLEQQGARARAEAAALELVDTP